MQKVADGHVPLFVCQIDRELPFDEFINDRQALLVVWTGSQGRAGLVEKGLPEIVLLIRLEQSVDRELGVHRMLECADEFLCHLMTVLCVGGLKLLQVEVVGVWVFADSGPLDLDNAELDVESLEVSSVDALSPALKDFLH